MLDPVLALAISAHNSKGVYALLLGSGVSRSAAIPTGWEIVIDLIRKLAHLKGESCDPDPEAWYKGLVGADPDYSDIIDQLTLSSAERALLLRSYFEPTEEDREQGRKMPSPAHRAIASLVSKGYVRVIVTTNFDRLIEQALTESGVQPTVISTTDAVKGALPLTHSPCTVVKVHGDYLDSRLRNTRPELSAYDKPLDDLLDRILDEFGLLVCGWSAEWDVALRTAIERCATHRFGTYWAAHKGVVSGEAQKLVALRRAVVVPIADADSFLRDLAEKIAALDNLSLVDPLSAQVAVARMKRYLAAPEQRINLHDLVGAEVERVHAGINSDRFKPAGRGVDSTAAVQRLRAYEAEVNVLLPLLACGGYWASAPQFRVLCRAITRLADDYVDQNGLVVWLKLRRYPALLAFYALGIAAVAAGNYELLNALFSMTVRTNKHRSEEPITHELTPPETISHEAAQQLIPGMERRHTPMNDYIFEVLRAPLQDYLPGEASLDRAFDTFEYLIGLDHCYRAATPEDLEKGRTDDRQFSPWAPIGRFVWNGARTDDHIEKRTAFSEGGPYPALVTAILRSGLFGASDNEADYERFRLIKQGFDRFLASVRRQMLILW